MITAGMSWLPWLVLAPLLGAVIAFVAPRIAPLIGILTATATAGCAFALAVHVHAHGAFRYAIAGWEAPLGIAWGVDGLSASLLALTAFIGLVISIYSLGYFRLPAGVGGHDRAH